MPGWGQMGCLLSRTQR